MLAAHSTGTKPRFHGIYMIVGTCVILFYCSHGAVVLLWMYVILLL